MLTERVWQYRARLEAYRRPHDMRFPAAQVLHRYCTGTRRSHTLGWLGQVGSVGSDRRVGWSKDVGRGCVGGEEGQDVKVEVMGGLLWALLCGLYNKL